MAICPRASGAGEHRVVVVIGLLTLITELEEAVGDGGGVRVDARRKQGGDVARRGAASRAFELPDPHSDRPDVGVGDPSPNAIAELDVGSREHLLDDAAADRMEDGEVGGSYSAAVSGVRGPAAARPSRHQQCCCGQQLIRLGGVAGQDECFTRPGRKLRPRL